jgi:hypothetical protein
MGAALGAAIHLLRLMEERFYLTTLSGDAGVLLASSLPSAYRRGARNLASRLAAGHPALASALIAEATRRADRTPPVRALSAYGRRAQ